MLDLVDRGYKLGLRILEMYGGWLKIGMGCHIHALIDRNTQHRPWVAAIEAAYIGPAAEEANAKGRLRRDHGRAPQAGTTPLDAKTMSTASRKSSTSRSGDSRVSQSRQP